LTGLHSKIEKVVYKNSLYPETWKLIDTKTNSVSIFTIFSENCHYWHKISVLNAV
jgi:hypothetical protein